MRGTVQQTTGRLSRMHWLLPLVFALIAIADFQKGDLVFGSMWALLGLAAALQGGASIKDLPRRRQLLVKATNFTGISLALFGFSRLFFDH